ncbi:sensor histidine kinase [Paenibacillus lutrae]|uniref:sensor histidine kinase n=1 Tax=Paenibacillus lutrae TaxID=2078573 RepID=UPI001F177C5E|nr:ATP-binding protein [Paenibacillus lutrae]
MNRNGLNRIGSLLLKGSVHAAVLFRNSLTRSLQLQLILAFILCMTASIFAGRYIHDLTKPLRDAETNYSMDVKDAKYEVYNIAYVLELLQNNPAARPESGAGQGKPGTGAKPPGDLIHPLKNEEIEQILNDHAQRMKSNFYIIDHDGEVLHRSLSSPETRFNLAQLIAGSVESQSRNVNLTLQGLTAMYPFELNGTEAFVVMKTHTVYPAGPSVPLAKKSGTVSIFAAVIIFILLFYWVTRRKIRYLEELAHGLVQMSRGNLDYRVKERSRDELGALAGHMNTMANELQLSIEEERKAQRLKTELITNVSHDLRTPLTIIIGYLRLLKDRDYQNPQQAEHYTQLAYGRAEKLKLLIEELFEFTRMSSKGVPLVKTTVCLNDLLHQLTEEYVGLAEQNHLTIQLSIPAEKYFVSIDADQMIRVFENLLTNAVKYSRSPSTIEITFREEQTEGRPIRVTVTNLTEVPDSSRLDQMFERFYRMDTARSSETGGSGLGLSIARSIAEAHGGRIWAESSGSKLSFHVRLLRP